MTPLESQSSQSRAQTTPDKAPRLVMLVNNPCVNDARVLRAANAAAETGFETIVLARGQAPNPTRKSSRASACSV